MVDVVYNIPFALLRRVHVDRPSGPSTRMPQFKWLSVVAESFYCCLYERWDFESYSCGLKASSVNLIIMLVCFSVALSDFVDVHNIRNRTAFRNECPSNFWHLKLAAGQSCSPNTPAQRRSTSDVLVLITSRPRRQKFPMNNNARSGVSLSSPLWRLFLYRVTCRRRLMTCEGSHP